MDQKQGRNSGRNRPLLIALFANAAGLFVIAFALLNRTNSHFPDFASPAMAQSQLPIGGGAGVFVVPAEFTSNTYGAYIMDVDAQTLAAYQFFPADKQLRLIASRSFRYDRRLGNYNTFPPPLDVRDLVEKESAEVRSSEQKNAPATPPEK